MEGTPSICWTQDLPAPLCPQFTAHGSTTPRSSERRLDWRAGRDGFFTYVPRSRQRRVRAFGHRSRQYTSPLATQALRSRGESFRTLYDENTTRVSQGLRHEVGHSLGLAQHRLVHLMVGGRVRDHAAFGRRGRSRARCITSAGPASWLSSTNLTGERCLDCSAGGPPRFPGAAALSQARQFDQDLESGGRRPYCPSIDFITTNYSGTLRAGLHCCAVRLS